MHTAVIGLCLTRSNGTLRRRVAYRQNRRQHDHTDRHRSAVRHPRPGPALVTPLDGYVKTLVLNDAIVQEQRIRLVLQPKPRFMPQWVWKRLIARLLVIQEQKT